MIKKVLTKNEEKESIYLIQAYHTERDYDYNRDILPSYLTSYSLTLGGDSFGLQSGLSDALKFKNIKTAQKWMKVGIEKFGEIRYFTIIRVDRALFGRRELDYLVAD